MNHHTDKPAPFDAPRSAALQAWCSTPLPPASRASLIAARIVATAAGAR